MTVAGVAEETGEPRLHRRRLLERLPPLVVHQQRGVVPRGGLGCVPGIGPRLVGVPGEEEPVGHAEPAIVWSEGVRSAAEVGEIHTDNMP